MFELRERMIHGRTSDLFHGATDGMYSVPEESQACWFQSLPP